MRAVNLEDILTMAKEARGSIDAIYLHWSAGHYRQPFSDYHINVDADEALYASTDDLTLRLAHTFSRNSRAVGVALLCCVGGNTNSLGKEPPTAAQIEMTARVVAALCIGLELPCIPEVIMTHAEAADLDDYGPATTCERWDLWFLADGQQPGTGGDILRAKANYYIQNGLSA